MPYMPAATMPSDSIGKGTYEIKKNKIILDYGEETVRNINVEKIRKDSPSELFNIDFNFYDANDSLGLPFVHVSFVRPSEGVLNGIITDFDGKENLQFKEMDFPIELNFKYLGYLSEKVYLENPENYEISIYFYGTPKILRGKREYEIERNKDTITINGLSKIIPSKKK